MEAAEPGRLSVGAGAAAQRLRVDYASAGVLRAFAAAGVRSILVKGPSLARWLYESDEHRTYADCDLLVPEEDFQAASAVMRELDYRPEVEEAEMPGWWREHGVTWFRHSDSSQVDLHRSLPGARLEGPPLWAALSARTEPIEVGGFTATTLTIPGRALHIALHVTQHAGTPRHVQELERALERTDDNTWREAAALAAELGATDAMATGLRFAPAGAALAERLGLPAETSIDASLRARGTPEALTVERFSQARGRARLAILWHKLFPPPTFIRRWSKLARRGRLGLVAAYLWRPFWVLGRTPAAVRSWLRARR